MEELTTKHFKIPCRQGLQKAKAASQLTASKEEEEVVGIVTYVHGMGKVEKERKQVLLCRGWACVHEITHHFDYAAGMDGNSTIKIENSVAVTWVSFSSSFIKPKCVCLLYFSTCA